MPPAAVGLRQAALELALEELDFAQANWYSASRSSSPFTRAFAMIRIRCLT